MRRPAGSRNQIGRVDNLLRLRSTPAGLFKGNSMVKNAAGTYLGAPRSATAIPRQSNGLSAWVLAEIAPFAGRSAIPSAWVGSIRGPATNSVRLPRRRLALRDGYGWELFYNFGVFPWLRVTPDVQLLRPGLGKSCERLGVRRRLAREDFSLAHSEPQS